MDQRELLNVKAQVIGRMMEWAIAKGGLNLKLVPLLEALIDAFDSVKEGFWLENQEAEPPIDLQERK